MAEAHLLQFLEKVSQLNAFVALTEADPNLRQQLQHCSHHNEVVALAARHGFEIGRRWGEGSPSQESGQSGQGLIQTAHGDRNLLQGTCPEPGFETTEILIEQDGWRLERIHSCQATSPVGFWYEQQEHEWVLLVQGTAEVQFADEATPRQLICGDSLWIEAGRRHRVVATDPAPGCVWVALFWKVAA